MLKYLIVVAVIVFRLGTDTINAQAANGGRSAVTAIDIALEPDATMLQHASALNVRLRGNFPKGYSLDATHRPHVTMLQRYVRTADLSKVYAAVERIANATSAATWKLRAFQLGNAAW